MDSAEQLPDNIYFFTSWLGNRTDPIHYFEISWVAASETWGRAEASFSVSCET